LFGSHYFSGKFYCAGAASIDTPPALNAPIAVIDVLSFLDLMRHLLAKDHTFAA
jgi:hypothetical protein